MKAFGIFAILIFSEFLFADFEWKSPYRDPQLSYLGYKSFASIASVPVYSNSDPNTPADRARRYGSVNLPAVTSWESRELLQSRFEEMRDYRWMAEASRPRFDRRITWLFPDDGCYARAGLAIRNLIRWNFPAPDKVFIFGDLRVKTPNTRSGEITWWYHVAPIVEVGGEKFVLDPSIEPGQPLSLEEWLSRHSTDITMIEVAICRSGTYAPYDSCARTSNGVEALAQSDQMVFLSPEWDRLQDLGRNPQEELGNNPPWLR